MSRKVLLTGAGGFVGSHVLRHFLWSTDWDIICPVTFRHHGNGGRITRAAEGIPGWEDRVKVIVWDLKTPFTKQMLNDGLGAVDYILNVASQSHVDRSISDPAPFIMNNVHMMINLLEYAREVNPEIFLHMSTDEVFGPANESYAHKEWDTIAPSNPYSASKAAQEAIAISYWRTFNVPVVITNTMNIIGEMQDPEKFVPMTIMKAMLDRTITIHSSAGGKPGSRFYIHARNFANAWHFIISNTKPNMYRNGDERPSRYNIVGEREIDNATMARMVCQFVAEKTGKRVNSDLDFIDFHSSRPGHDLRYALDGSKLSGLGWSPPISLEDSLRNVVYWTVDHPEWLL